ncbi:hypothetical protein ACE193_02845 [Bernardetia sp. OM2101]|uniref:hypothetical protein n=1 Tax=Bernardetia sp. OM2101 TaxID=3344876 RepID=UPI0035CFB8EB
MNIQKIAHFNLKSILHLSLLGIVLSFSAFSCEVYEPLEIKIENKTGYDLTDIKIDEVSISSLKNGATSNYISTKDFEYMKSISAKVKGKFEKELSSFGTDSGLWCGWGKYPTKESGKHSFVIILYNNDGRESLGFEEK